MMIRQPRGVGRAGNGRVLLHLDIIKPFFEQTEHFGSLGEPEGEYKHAGGHTFPN
jgi:hypothetical protein